VTVRDALSSPIKRVTITGKVTKVAYFSCTVLKMLVILINVNGYLLTMLLYYSIADTVMQVH